MSVGGRRVGGKGISSSLPSPVENQATSLGKPPHHSGLMLPRLLGSHSVSRPGSGLPLHSGSPVSLDPEVPEQRLHQHSQLQQHVSPAPTVALVLQH